MARLAMAAAFFLLSMRVMMRVILQCRERKAGLIDESVALDPNRKHFPLHLGRRSILSLLSSCKSGRLSKTFFPALLLTARRVWESAADWKLGRSRTISFEHLGLRSAGMANADTDDKLFVGKASAAQYLSLNLANRHGLVTGATGTGKTVTLQTIAEGFSRAGVPVFAADIKGDLSGIAAVGDAKDAFVKRAKE
jgi:hypothetical protein